MVHLQIGEVYRYGKDRNSSSETSGGFSNYFYVTHYHNQKLLLLERGINPVAEIKAVDGMRRAAILIRSSPHKIGSESTPWQDIFDVDNGHIRYYGDNKTPGKDPALSTGNKILLKAFEEYNNAAKRKNSVPLVFYKSVSRNKKSKGYVQFNGFGIIRGVELITQYDRDMDRTFSNYAFDFQVFSLSEENELFSWDWINDRRNAKLKLGETLRYAPNSWQKWISIGNNVLERYRRRVSKLMTYSKAEQLPEKGSKEEKVLWEVYKYFENIKHRFEVVASKVAAKIIADQTQIYREGWITPPNSDGGADFYGRIEIGTGFGKAKVIVLGQAKCQKPTEPTNGNDIARTVARLRRGWLGVYVTTSFFSLPVQREIIEDEYPILLINGKKLSEALLKIMYDEGFSSISKLLSDLNLQYDSKVKIRRPDELFFEA
jgi:hypothetical protein